MIFFAEAKPRCQTVRSRDLSYNLVSEMVDTVVDLIRWPVRVRVFEARVGWPGENAAEWLQTQAMNVMDSL
jgi:hypothetical protein